MIDLNQIPKEAWIVIGAAIGTIGTIIAAIIAIMGILLNNIFENRRKKIARKKRAYSRSLLWCVRLSC